MFVHGAKLAFSLQIDTVWGHLLDSLSNGSLRLPHYSAKIVTDEITGTNPIVEFVIKGLNSIDTPVLEYNGVAYTLENVGNDTFRSERLNLVDTASKVIVKIGENFKSTFNIRVSTGAQEDDLFDF